MAELTSRWERGWRERWRSLGLPTECMEGALAYAWAVGTEDDDLVAWTARVLLDLRMGNTRTDADRWPDLLPGRAAQDSLQAGVERGWLRRDETNPTAGLVWAGKAVFASRIFALERQVRDAVQQRLAGARPVRADGARVPAELTDEQRQAVARCLVQPMTLLTGGPGTGKSTVIGAAVRAHLDAGGRGDDVALAAPTGKAAQRLNAGRQDVPEARTLHRLLGYRPREDRFSVGPERPLPARLVVVDEATMIDLRLMHALLLGLHPEVRLILAGDPDQLPSVDAGAAFRDLTARHRDWVAPLTQNHRVRAGAGRIAEVAEAVRRGRTPDVAWSARPPFEPGVCGVELASDGGLQRFVDRWYARWLAHLADRATLPDDPEQALDLLRQAESAKILTPVREGIEGSVALNARLARARRGRAWSGLVPGQPVIMTRNDYGRRLFNGDLGLVVDARGELRALFRAPVGSDTVVRSFALGSLAPDLEPADALTVHKAQGSEFEHVAVLLPSTDSVAGRSYLYTAVTRARTSAWVLGTTERLASVIARNELRTTGLEP